MYNGGETRRTSPRRMEIAAFGEVCTLTKDNCHIQKVVLVRVISRFAHRHGMVLGWSHYVQRPRKGPTRSSSGNFGLVLQLKWQEISWNIKANARSMKKKQTNKPIPIILKPRKTKKWKFIIPSPFSLSKHFTWCRTLGNSAGVRDRKAAQWAWGGTPPPPQILPAPPDATMADACPTRTGSDYTAESCSLTSLQGTLRRLSLWGALVCPDNAAARGTQPLWKFWYHSKRIKLLLQCGRQCETNSSETAMPLLDQTVLFPRERTAASLRHWYLSQKQYQTVFTESLNLKYQCANTRQKSGPFYASTNMMKWKGTQTGGSSILNICIENKNKGVQILILRQRK